MAEAQTLSIQGALTRGKVILIAVLAVVLVVVLYVQFGSARRKGGASSVTYRPPRPASARHTAASAPKSGLRPVSNSPARDDEVVAPIIDTTHWKSPPLDTVVAYDPFALPPAFPQPKVRIEGKSASAESLIAAAAADDARKRTESLEQLQTQLQELKQRGVNVIVRDHDQYAAMIGDRMLHVGDEIDGFTVTAISPDCVRIEKKELP